MEIRHMALLAAGIACSSGGEPAPVEPKGAPPPDMARLCEAVCEREATCGRPGPCPERCRREGPDAERLRADYLWRVLSCIDDVECQFVMGGNTFRYCDDVIGRQLSTTASLRRFCFESSHRAAVCGRGNDAEQGDCLQRFRAIDDNALDAGRACLAEGCDAVPACLARAFGM
jgi:hypothetical protein